MSNYKNLFPVNSKAYIESLPQIINNFLRIQGRRNTISRNKNEGIEADEIRLIDKDGEHIGVVSIEEALVKAEEAELDLVEVDPSQTPPICKIMEEAEKRPNGKDGNKIEIDLDEVIEEYPFTIAYSYNAMKNSETIQEKFRRMLLTYIQTVRYLGLLSLSDYLNKDDFKEKEINDKIENLRRPSLGNWKDFVFTTKRRYDENEKEFFSPDIFEKLELIKSKNFSGCYRGDINDPQHVKNNAFDAFIELRNLYSHGAIISKEKYKDMVEQYLPMMEFILENLHILRNYRPLRMYEVSGDRAEYVSLTGSSREFKVKETDEDTLVSRLREHLLVLYSKENEISLPLYPFMVDLDKKIMESHADEFFEPFYLYEGYTSKKVSYLGSRSKKRVKTLFDQVKTKLEEKEIKGLELSRDKISPWTIHDFAKDVTKATIDRYEGRKYIPEVYQNRPEIEGHLKAFMESDKTGFFIVGEAGSGKTSLMCERAKFWMEAKQDDVTHLGEGHIILFISANGMDIGKNIKNPLFKRLREELVLSSEVETIKELLRLIDDKRDRDQIKDREFVLMIDAVNEAVNPPHVLKRIEKLIDKGKKYDWFKVIFTMRKENYKILKSKFKGTKKRIWFEDKSPYFKVEVEKGGKKEESMEIPLKRFDEDELREAYEKYQAKDEIPSPKTNFQSLTKDIKNIIKKPFLLKVFNTIFDGEEVPRSISELELFKQYHEKLIQDDEEIEIYLNKLVKRLFNEKTDRLKYEDVDSIVKYWEEKESDVNAIINLNPLERLKDEGVLQEITEYSPDKTEKYDYIKFTHQRYFEYLLKDRIKLVNDDIDGEKIIDLLEKDIKMEDFPEYYGALEILLTEMAQESRYRPIVHAINNGPNEIKDIVSKVLQNLEESEMATFEMDEDEIRNTGCSRLSRNILDNISEQGIEVLLDFVPNMYSLGGVKRCQEILEELENKKTLRKEEKKYSNLLMWLGNIYSTIGAPEYALDKYERALEINRELEDKDRIATGLNNIGRIHMNKGEYNQALEKFESVLEIEQELGYKGKIATTLNNIGGTHKLKGDYDQALKNLNSAQNINMEIGDKSRMSTNLINIGMIHELKGEYDQALKKYERALEMDQELGDKIGIATCLNNIGGIQEVRGKYDQALEKYERVLEMNREMGHKEGRASNLINIGSIHQKKGEYDQALEKFEDVLEMVKELKDKKKIAVTLNSIGLIKYEKGKYDHALEDLERALEIFREMGDKRGIATQLNNIGPIIHETRGKHEKALEKFGRALEIARELGDKDRIATSLNNIGSIHEANEEYEKALEKFERALEIYRELGDKSKIGCSLNNLATINYAKGEYDQALEKFEGALNIFIELEEKPRAIQVYDNLIPLLKEIGRKDEAIEKANEEIDYLLGSNNLAELYKAIAEMLLKGKKKDTIEENITVIGLSDNQLKEIIEELSSRYGLDFE